MSINLKTQAPPRGQPCTACKLSGTNCALDSDQQPITTGEPIFDTFRYHCLNWADEVRMSGRCYPFGCILTCLMGFGVLIGCDVMCGTEEDLTRFAVDSRAV